MRQWKYVVFVRGVDGTGEVYGVYGSEAAAQRKADAINRRAPQEADSEVWAYPMPLRTAVEPAAAILTRAGV